MSYPLKQIIFIFIGGVLIVVASALAVYVDTSSTVEVIDVLLMRKIKSVGLSTIFGYLLIVVSVIRLLVYLVSSQHNDKPQRN